VRRGDLRDKMLDDGFTVEYYKKLIRELKKHFRYEVFVYCEKSNWEDLKSLHGLCQLKIGNSKKQDFSEMVRSKILIIGNSAFSLVASYCSTNIHLIDYHNLQKYVMKE
jgi:hypothetical protein